MNGLTLRVAFKIVPEDSLKDLFLFFRANEV